MGIALSTTSRLSAPLSVAMGRLWTDKTGAANASTTHPSGMPRRHGLRLVAPPARARTRTLRVVRVLDDTAQPTCAGRMTISGSMEDVCAELDRLIAAQQKP